MDQLSPKSTRSNRSSDSKSTSSPTSPTKDKPRLPPPRKLSKRNSSQTSNLTVGQFLTPQLQGARDSSLSLQSNISAQSNISMQEIASQRERPGVMTPSRKDTSLGKRDRPEPPQARRSGWLHKHHPHVHHTHPSHHSKDAKDLPQPYFDDDEKTLVGMDAKFAVEITTEPVEEEPEAESRGSSPTSATKTTPTASKKPPPIPKARRGWRGWGESSSRKAEPGKFSTNMSRLEAHKSKSSLPELPTPSKTLSGDELGSPGASVSSALEIAQAQAISSISETLEKATLMSPTNEQIVTTVLTPPSPAPARPIPGPTMALEKSPFLGDEEDEQPPEIVQQ